MRKYRTLPIIFLAVLLLAGCTININETVKDEPDPIDPDTLNEARFVGTWTAISADGNTVWTYSFYSDGDYEQHGVAGGFNSVGNFSGTYSVEGNKLKRHIPKYIFGPVEFEFLSDTQVMIGTLLFTKQ